MVENVDEFNRWLIQMIKDAKEKLSMTEETIAFVLLEQAAHMYYRLLGMKYLRDANGYRKRIRDE